jgi:hypothetical protein
MQKLQKNIKKISDNTPKENLKKTYKKKRKIIKIYGRPFSNKILEKNKISFLNFHVYPNNAFITYKIKDKDPSKFIILNKGSFGKYKIPVSKKSVKYKLKFLIKAFFKEFNQKKIYFKNLLAIKVIAPIKLKKLILRTISHKVKKKDYLIDISDKKVFNGCRAKKKIRKKAKRLRLYK